MVCLSEDYMQMFGALDALVLSTGIALCTGSSFVADSGRGLYCGSIH